MDTTLELSRSTIETYGGNYAFYEEQKRMERSALDQDIRNREKALRKAKEIERESIERQQKRNAGGKKKQEKAGMPKILMDRMKDSAEKSSTRLKGIHAEKTDALSQEVKQLRKELPGMDKMKLGFENSGLHKRKILITAKDVNFGYDEEMLWPQPLSFCITSGERIALKGGNGSGKTTLLRLILGELQPQIGTIERAEMQTLYIDQDYSLVDNRLSVYEQAQKHNHASLPEHEVKTRLTRFLFTRDFWDKPCLTLSGGERMRLILCCLAIRNQAPDMIILDEPTNNLDIQNTDMLTTAIREYQGTLLVVSHDVYFLEQIQITHSL
jgi:ATPase subunit of ABC transporter with duplicated ATPase domains